MLIPMQKIYSINPDAYALLEATLLPYTYLYDKPPSMGMPLTHSQFMETCEILDVTPAHLWTLLSVETIGLGFLLKSRLPKILFERHKFYKYADKSLAISYPSLSNPRPGGYGTPGIGQWRRFLIAFKLSPKAAVYSCSWGIGQVMGYHHDNIAGITSWQRFLAWQFESESAQLYAVRKYLEHTQLHISLRNQEWKRIAHIYNGPTYNEYAYKLKQTYKRYVQQCPDVHVRFEQILLAYAGISPGPIDGMLGSRTEKALETYEQRYGKIPLISILST
jgi:hypothetical protein